MQVLGATRDPDLGGWLVDNLERERRRGSAPRCAADPGPEVLEREGIRLDTAWQMAEVNGTPVKLTGREFAILEILMRNAGCVTRRSIIWEKVWPSSLGADLNTLHVYMKRLRRKMEPALGRELVRTTRGVGYQLI